MRSRPDNGVVDKAYLEAEGGDSLEFVGEWGFAIHFFFVGFLLFQLVALIFLIVSFFAKVQGGVPMAAGMVGLVILQVWVLPFLSSEVGSGFGALHGVNALLILGLALMSAKRASGHAGTHHRAARHRLIGGLPRPHPPVAGVRRDGRLGAAPGLVLAGEPAARQL